MNLDTSKRTILIGADQTQSERYQRLVAEHGSPLLVYKPQVLEAQFKSLRQALPGVELYYAVKAHPDPHIIETIDKLGGGFDVASAGEMDLLLQHKVSGRRTIHTHPIKKDSEIRDALRFGSTTFVVDSLYELQKLVPYRSRIGVLLRVSFRSESATVDLSRKFGCDVSEVAEIAHQAEQLGVHIKGLSFHVGSQCKNAEKHRQAIIECRDLMLEINQKAKRPMSVMDIGGGFPADYQLSGFDIAQFCQPIREALNSLPSDWHLLAEPGRYLVAPAVTSITSVAGKSRRSGVNWYYLDDGVYGSYSGQIFDHTIYPLQVLKTQNPQLCVLAGPTCDSIDVIGENLNLPELEIGDLVIGLQMGAYTAATKTRFNSIADAKFVLDE